MPPTPLLDATGPSRATVAVLLALACVPFFLGLAHPPLWDANEPFYVEPAKEALTWPEGSVWAPTFNGRTYFGHPPLGAWLVTASYALFGIDEGTGRLPGALAACALVLATFALGRTLGGRRTGLLAALALAATPRVWLFARQLAGDAAFAALLAWAYALAASGAQRGSAARLRAAHALAGLATLAKGPLALALYVPGLLLTARFAAPRVPVRALRPWSGLALALLVGAPWFAAMSVAFWPEFPRTFFGWHNFGRFTGAMPGGRPPWFYLGVLLADAEPWLLLLPPAWVLFRRRPDRGFVAWLPWMAGAWMLLLLSASAGKRNVYLLPLYPLLAVAVAPVLEALWTTTSRALAGWCAVVIAVTTLGGASGLWLLIHAEPRTAPAAWVPFAVFVAGGGVALASLLRISGRAAVVTGIAALLAAQASVAFALEGLDRLRPVPALAAAIRAAEDPARPEPAVVYRARITSLPWYLGRPAEVVGDAAALSRTLGDARKAFVLCAEGHADELRAEMRAFELMERARAPMLDLQYGRVILGRRAPTAEIVLYEALRR